MRKIHNFIVTGVIGDDAHLMRARENYERVLLQQMRDKGYIPVLDMDSQFTISYIEKRDEYGFSLTMFGIYVGKKKADKYIGFSGQEFIPRG